MRTGPLYGRLPRKGQFYPILPEPWVWALARVAIGFCYCGVYITAESWLNASSTNETRGQALSAYAFAILVSSLLFREPPEKADAGAGRRGLKPAPTGRASGT